jgi:RNase P/RNase MRP subunit POP5
MKPLAASYVYQDDTKALEAGQRLAVGDYSRANIEAIFRWKTGGRGISRLRRNSDGEIRDALRLAVKAETERAGISVLCGLSGVEVPVASAILTAIDPERYTIIDFRALEALGVKNTWHTVDSYLAPSRLPGHGAPERS